MCFNHLFMETELLSKENMFKLKLATDIKLLKQS